jgi:KDO2-lipid IV(A) lauroyltransferase
MRKLLGWLGLALSFILVHLPAWVRRGLGCFLGFLWFDVFRIRRQIVLDNLTRAFPNMSEKEKIRIGRQSLFHLGRNFVDYAYLPFLNKSNFENLFEFHNLEVLDRALARGKGVMLLTLHLGHGDLGSGALSLKGYKIFMVSKFFKLQWLNDAWFGMRRKLGTEFIGPRNSTFPLLRALKSNSIVILPLDQFTGPPIGVRTKFFGVETGTAAGFAIMAHRSKATVISVYAVRTKENKHAIHFVEEVPVPLIEGSDQSLIDVTQSFNNRLEEFVKQHPEQWMWIHRRWKRFVV